MIKLNYLVELVTLIIKLKKKKKCIFDFVSLIPVDNAWHKYLQLASTTSSLSVSLLHQSSSLLNHISSNYILVPEQSGSASPHRHSWQLLSFP